MTLWCPVCHECHPIPEEVRWGGEFVAPEPCGCRLEVLYEEGWDGEEETQQWVLLEATGE